MKFCKDCARFTSDPKGSDGLCDKPVSYNLVSGEPHFNAPTTNRWDDRMCGARGAWFVPKAKQKPEGPKNNLEPSPEYTLGQKLKLLFK